MFRSGLPYVIEVMSDVWLPKLVPVNVSVVAVLGLIGLGETAVITGAGATVNVAADAGDDWPKTITITLYVVLATSWLVVNLISVGDIHCMFEPNAPVPFTPYLTLLISERLEPKFMPVTVITVEGLSGTMVGDRLEITGGAALVVKLTWLP